MWILNFLRLAMALAGFAFGECCPAEEARAAAPCPQDAQRVGVDFNAPPPCRYRVAVRQTGDAGSTLTWPNVELDNGQAATTTVLLKDRNGECRRWAQCVGVREGKHGKVALELRLSCRGQDGNVCKYATEANIPTGKEAMITLGGDTPEPLCVSVKLARLEAQMGTCVAPPAATAVAMMPRPAMPAPMPVAMPAPACQPAMPAPMPVQPLMPNSVGFTLPFPSPVLPHPMPIQMPMPAPPAPPMLWHVQVPQPVATPVCVAFTQAPVQAKAIRLVKEDGRAKVEMRGAAGTLRAVKMTVEEGACGKMHLSAGSKQIHLKGHEWSAQADRAEVCADGTVTLRGHVKLTCEKLGDDVSVAGNVVSFRVKAGHFVELLSK